MYDDTRDDETTRGDEPLPEHVLEPEPPRSGEGDDSVMLSARNFSEWASRPSAAPFLELDMPPLPAPSLQMGVMGMTERLWTQLCYLCRVV